MTTITVSSDVLKAACLASRRDIHGCRGCDEKRVIKLSSACIGFDVTLSLDDFLLVKYYIKVK